MSMTSSPFDPVAEMYHTLWDDWYLASAMSALDKMFFSRIPAGARVLDVCCGCGHVTKELVRREYQVTGVDASAGLIAIARREMPEVDWRVQDARGLKLEGGYAGALSTFDSLNHLSSVEDLGKVFRSVYKALQPGGRFSFDMNLDEAYHAGPQHWMVEVHDATASLIRGSYNFETKKAITELVWFVRESDGELWRQYRSTIHQRSYTQSEILTTLSEAGFRAIEAMPGEDAGMTDGLGIGRLFVSAQT